MKILAFGDIHGDSGHAEKLAARAEKEKVDLVILCGDITRFDEHHENILGPFVKKKQKVLIIPGNHDSFATADFLAEVYGVKNIHGYSVQYEDVGIFGCGGANIGPTMVPDKEIYALLKKGFDKIKDLPKRIMVTHVHPADSLIEKFSRFTGSAGVKKALEAFQPDLLLCSHIHEAAGLEDKIGKTRVINVGKEGKILTI
ncbi:MAG TPA: metallophosphoesterase [Candidatus Nanoarchaeia archaeon]|nr:metallophosphoesterase [Candidatus Nanoarchaeia archaeon]